MTDSSSSARDDAPTDSGACQCDHCGSLLDLSTWTPTIMADDQSIYRFCDDECRDAWLAA